MKTFLPLLVSALTVTACDAPRSEDPIEVRSVESFDDGARYELAIGEALRTVEIAERTEGRAIMVRDADDTLVGAAVALTDGPSTFLDPAGVAAPTLEPEGLDQTTVRVLDAAIADELCSDDPQFRLMNNGGFGLDDEAECKLDCELDYAVCIDHHPDLLPFNCVSGDCEACRTGCLANCGGLKPFPTFY